MLGQNITFFLSKIAALWEEYVKVWWCSRFCDHLPAFLEQVRRKCINIFSGLLSNFHKKDAHADSRKIDYYLCIQTKCRCHVSLVSGRGANLVTIWVSFEESPWSEWILMVRQHFYLVHMTRRQLTWLRARQSCCLSCGVKQNLFTHQIEYMFYTLFVAIKLETCCQLPKESSLFFKLFLEIPFG